MVVIFWIMVVIFQIMTVISRIMVVTLQKKLNDFSGLYVCPSNVCNATHWRTHSARTNRLVYMEHNCLPLQCFVLPNFLNVLPRSR
jgi:hypothetical protein